MEFLVVVGRVLFALIFITSGIAHLTKTEAMVGMVPLSSPRFWVQATGVMILLGGLSVMLGVFPKVGAALLLAFLVPTAFLMHRYWDAADPMTAANQMAHFNKNLALAGAALLILSSGTGPFSLIP